MFTRTASVAAGVGVALAISSSARRAGAAPTAEDITTLTGILSAEYNAINLYGAAIADGTGLIDSSSADAATKTAVKTVATHFQTQHIDHANALKALIGADAPAQPTTLSEGYLPTSFPSVPSIVEILQIAADKEKQAALAYADALKAVSDETTAQLLSSIGGVETQHFVVLYLLAEGIIQLGTGASGEGLTAEEYANIVPTSFITTNENGGSLEATFPNVPFKIAGLT